MSHKLYLEYNHYYKVKGLPMRDYNKGRAYRFRGVRYNFSIDHDKIYLFLKPRSIARKIRCNCGYNKGLHYQDVLVHENGLSSRIVVEDWIKLTEEEVDCYFKKL